MIISAAAVSAIIAAFKLVEELLPVIEQHVHSGLVTKEQQEEIRAKYNSIKTKADGQFQGDHWQV